MAKHEYIESDESQYSRYQKALFQFSHKGTTTKDLGSFLKYCVKELGELSGVSRVYIFENHGKNLASLTYEWVRNDTKPCKEKLQNLSHDKFPFWNEALQSYDIIYSTDITKDLPPHVHSILQRQNIKSILVVPFFAHDKIHGVLGLDECKFQKKWTESEIYLIRTMAQIIGNAISKHTGLHERQHLEARVLSIQNLMQDIINSANEVIIFFDYSFKVMFWNKSAEELTGIGAGAIIGKHLSEIKLDFHHNHVLKMFRRVLKSGDSKRITLNMTTHKGIRRAMSFSFSRVEDEEASPQGIICIGSDITPTSYTDRQLLPGNTYLMSDPSNSFDTFFNVLSKGNPGLYISRINPSIVETKYGQSGFKYFWMDALFDQKSYLSDFEALIQDFITKNKNAVILFERVDYIIGMFGFEKFLRLLYKLNSMTIKSHATMILSLNPGVVNDRELSYIEQETQSINTVAMESHVIAAELLELLKYIKAMHNHGISVSLADITKKFSVTRPTASERIRRLTELDLVMARTIGRKKEISITDKGKNFLSQLEV